LSSALAKRRPDRRVNGVMTGQPAGMSTTEYSIVAYYTLQRGSYMTPILTSPIGATSLNLLPLPMGVRSAL
jgi:hypothetical protein